MLEKQKNVLNKKREKRNGMINFIGTPGYRLKVHIASFLDEVKKVEASHEIMSSLVQLLEGQSLDKNAFAKSMRKIVDSLDATIIENEKFIRLKKMMKGTEKEIANADNMINKSKELKTLLGFKDIDYTDYCKQIRAQKKELDNEKQSQQAEYRRQEDKLSKIREKSEHPLAIDHFKETLEIKEDFIDRKEGELSEYESEVKMLTHRTKNFDEDRSKLSKVEKEIMSELDEASINLETTRKILKTQNNLLEENKKIITELEGTPNKKLLEYQNEKIEEYENKLKELSDIPENQEEITKLKNQIESLTENLATPENIQQEKIIAEENFQKFKEESDEKTTKLESQEKPLKKIIDEINAIEGQDAGYLEKLFNEAVEKGKNNLSEISKNKAQKDIIVNNLKISLKELEIKRNEFKELASLVKQENEKTGAEKSTKISVDISPIKKILKETDALDKYRAEENKKVEEALKNQEITSEDEKAQKIAIENMIVQKAVNFLSPLKNNYLNIKESMGWEEKLGSINEKIRYIERKRQECETVDYLKNLVNDFNSENKLENPAIDNIQRKRTGSFFCSPTRQKLGSNVMKPSDDNIQRADSMNKRKSLRITTDEVQSNVFGDLGKKQPISNSQPNEETEKKVPGKLRKVETGDKVVKRRNSSMSQSKHHLFQVEKTELKDAPIIAPKKPGKS